MHKLSRASLVFQCIINNAGWPFSFEEKKLFSISLERKKFTSEKPIWTRLATAALHSGSGVGPKRDN